MSPTDRAEFDKQITVMIGGFPGYFLTPERKESYWRGLQKIPMSSLVRVVDFVLGEEGPEKIPGVSALWTIYRNLRSAPRFEAPSPEDTRDNFDRLADHLLLNFLRRHCVSVLSIKKMLEQKSAIISSIRAGGFDANENGGEVIRDKLNAAFKQLHRTASDDELEFHRDQIARTGNVGLPPPKYPVITKAAA